MGPTYLPLSPGVLSILAGLFVLVLVLVQIGALHRAYVNLGIGSKTALVLLLGSMIGSYFNLPLAEFPDQQVVQVQNLGMFGLGYAMPTLVDWPGTIVAINIGGALIPIAMSVYLMIRNRLWGLGLIATACVAAVCRYLAEPVPGFGIAVPVFMPVVVTAIVAMMLSRRYAAPLAYVGGSLGMLIGADLLNLPSVQELGAPVVSIGGAGTFDGIFVTGIIAVLIAGLSQLLPSRVTGSHF